MYTLRFSDGTEQGNLECVGTNTFRHKGKPENVRLGWARDIQVCSDDVKEPVQTISTAEIQGFWHEASGGVVFMLYEPTDAEVEQKKLASNVAYIALMTGVDIDE